MTETFKIVMILFITFTGCISAPYEENNIPDRFGGNSNTMILNYENRSASYKDSIVDSHMRIYIEIEKPYVISSPPPVEMDRIYSISQTEGTTIYRLQLDETGKILSSEKTLSAGLGMDEVADGLLKKIKIEPAYLAGKPGSSSADLKIIFRADRTE